MSIKTSMPAQGTSAVRRSPPMPRMGGSTIRTSQPPERLIEASVKGPDRVSVGTGSNIVISNSGALAGRLFLPPEVATPIRALTSSTP